MSSEINKANPWQKLKEFTNARVALGHTGSSMPLREVLALKLAHAQAKDAIDHTLAIELLRSKAVAFNIPFYHFHSEIKDREEYLLRPDLGRRLSSNIPKSSFEKADIVFVLTDGLSANAVNKYSFKVLDKLLLKLKTKYKIALVAVEQGRVAIGDQVAQLFHADFVAVFIGERPGLSSPESMGIYSTFQPKDGFTDEKRNCISNIHQNGLSSEQGATLLDYLITQSFARQVSGVALKIDSKLLGNN